MNQIYIHHLCFEKSSNSDDLLQELKNNTRKETKSDNEIENF